MQIVLRGCIGALLSLYLVLSAVGNSNQTIVIEPSGSQASETGSAENFTGRVRIDSPFDRADPARVAGSVVTFEPGARTAWHSHPLGQTLIVTSGTGWVQQWGGARQNIKPGM